MLSLYHLFSLSTIHPRKVAGLNEQVTFTKFLKKLMWMKLHLSLKSLSYKTLNLFLYFEGN